MIHYEFRLPDVGEGTTEAEIVAWHVAVGDQIEEDRPLMEVSTDKAIVEIPSPVTGRVLVRHGEVGERMAVGSVLVEIQIGAEGSASSTIDSGPEQESQPRGVTPAAESAQTSLTASTLRGTPSSTPIPEFGAPRASPTTRRRAFELGAALESIVGTGPSGRITDADVEQHVRGRTAVETQREPIEASTESAQEIKIIGLRRIIAEKMVLSKRNIPHFTFVEEIDVTELEALRVNLNEQRGPDKPKLTPLPFLMRGVVKLVPAFPSVNARYDEDTRLLRCYKAVHIGIATQTEAGLMVPVVRNAQDLDLWESARQIQRLSEAARAGRAIRDELVGSTITLTSLGALGGVSATPIINHPEVAIIGPNKMVERPVVRHGAVVVRTMMNLSASFDHRIIDGYEAARFVQELKRLIEQPALLFLDAS